MQIENTMLPDRREMVVMRKRPLGETGIEVPWVSLGTSPLGYTGTGSLVDSIVNSVKQGVVPDADAIHLIKNALDMQANLIDTSPLYGNGRAERLVGEAVKERRSRATIVAKVVGPFDAASMEESFSASLMRLQTNYVDVLLLDNPGDEVLDASHQAWSWLARLKDEGKIKAYGAAVSGAQRLKAAAENTPAQVLQTRFSIFDQHAAEAFEAIQARRIGLLACAPLDSGFLGGRYSRFSVFFDPRKRWSRSQVWRRGSLRDKVEALRPATVSLAQMALQFVLAHDAVSSAVVGVKDQHQLIYNVDSTGGVLEDVTLDGLRKLWLDEIDGAGLTA